MWNKLMVRVYALVYVKEYRLKVTTLLIVFLTLAMVIQKSVGLAVGQHWSFGDVFWLGVALTMLIYFGIFTYRRRAVWFTN